jgi:Carbohydrate binding domain
MGDGSWVDMGNPEQWIEDEPGIWMTRGGADPINGRDNILPNPSFETDTSSWLIHTENGAQASLIRDKVEFNTPPAGACVSGTTSGTEQNHIQLLTYPFSVTEGNIYRLTFMARASVPFTFISPVIMKSTTPWSPYGTMISPTRLPITTEWQKHQVTYIANQTASDGRLTFFLGSEIPSGENIYIDTVALGEYTKEGFFFYDVGNVIFNEGESCGIKVWENTDLDEPGEYWYDENNLVVKMVAEDNPGNIFDDVEFALKRYLIYQGRRSYITYENLDLRYGAAHGIGGGNTHHIIVRHCDFSFIGGADQYGGDQEVRYGNGIEFWGNASNNLVECCRFWEIYDAAITNQNNGEEVIQRDITYRNNIIWNSEYSFEYWNGPESSITSNIIFENNTCVNAGGGWGHTQRPNPSGRHLCFYNNDAATTGLVIQNNIFYKALGNSFYASGWSSEKIDAMTINANCWYQQSGIMINLMSNQYTMAEFQTYQSETNKEADSMATDPLLTDPNQLAFGLSKDSPCIDSGLDTDRVSDFLTIPVPQGATPDIGALEFIWLNGWKTE